MAPKKRKAAGDADPAGAAAMTAGAASRRVTRSSSRLANAGSVAEKQPELPEKKAKQSKKGKEKETEVKEEEAKTENMEAEVEAEVSGKTVVIEHCKQCTQFKTRANKVKEGLEKGVPGITVLVNPDKPRRGCFEIREEGGDTFVSLLDMKRPFEAMRALDMEQVISDIIDKVK